jgi:hypothetical protein
MAKCVPGMPCYDNPSSVIVYTTYPAGCSSCYGSNNNCVALPISSAYLYYGGPNLPYSGVNTEDTLTVALQKIDDRISDVNIFEAFMAAIINDAELKARLCEQLSDCP